METAPCAFHPYSGNGPLWKTFPPAPPALIRHREHRGERLFRRVGSQPEFAGTAGIHKFQFNVLSDALDVMVGPILEGIGLRFTAALIQRSLVVLALCMALERVRLAVHDVDAAAICPPSRDTRGEMLVGISDAAVVLLLNRIIDRVWVRTAPLPKLLDEVFTLLVCLQLQKSSALRIGNDVDDVFVEPLFVRGRQFLQNLLLIDFFLSIILLLVL